jgi:hypothetical protein
VDVEKFSVNQRETYKILFEEPVKKVTEEYYYIDAKCKLDGAMSTSDYMIYVYLFD